MDTERSRNDMALMAGDEGQSELSISVLERENGHPCAVVSLAGRACIGDCAWVRLFLGRLAAQGRDRLVVDLSRLSSMDRWVALILIWVGRVASRRGGVLVLASPQPAVARLLNAAGAPAAVAVCESLQEASGIVAVPAAARPAKTFATR